MLVYITVVSQRRNLCASEFSHIMLRHLPLDRGELESQAFLLSLCENGTWEGFG